MKMMSEALTAAGQLGGEREALLGGVALDDFLEAGLVDRNLAALERLDLVDVGIDADDVVAVLGETRSDDQADVARADDRNPHALLLPARSAPVARRSRRTPRWRRGRRVAERLTLAYVPVRVLLDYRPALRARTGVGEYVHRTAIALAATAPPGGRRGGLLEQLEGSPAAAGPGDRDVVMPMSRCGPSTGRGIDSDGLPSSGWPGDVDVAHSPTPLLLPAARAAQVVTIHDLFFLDHPQATAAEIRRDYPSARRRARPTSRPGRHRVGHGCGAGRAAARRRSGTRGHLPQRRTRVDRPHRTCPRTGRSSASGRSSRARTSAACSMPGPTWSTAACRVPLLLAGGAPSSAAPLLDRFDARPARRRRAIMSATSRKRDRRAFYERHACWCCPHSTRASASPPSRPWPPVCRSSCRGAARCPRCVAMRRCTSTRTTRGPWRQRSPSCWPDPADWRTCGSAASHAHDSSRGPRRPSGCGRPTPRRVDRRRPTLMRIGVDARELGGRPTGVGRYLRELLVRWQADPACAGHELVMFTPRADQDTWTTPKGRGARFSWQLVPGAGGTLWEQRDLARAARAARSTCSSPRPTRRRCWCRFAERGGASTTCRSRLTRSGTPGVTACACAGSRDGRAVARTRSSR